MWQTLSSKEIFSHPRLTLVEDDVLLPSGQSTTYLKFKDHGESSVSIIAVREDGKILVQREYSHPLGRPVWQFPGGGVHPGEDIDLGANRELREESGLRADTLLRLGSYFGYHRRLVMPTYAYLATNLAEDPIPGDPEESIESHWRTEAEVNAMIRTGEFEDGFSLAAWSLYKARE